MRIAIIGSGIVGLSLARELLRYDRTIQIVIYDSYSVPSKCTSVRNSGVLHAGLYYTPQSLKAELCRSGRDLLQQYITDNGLPLSRCGKLLVPHSQADLIRLEVIKEKADLNHCETYLIDHASASQIQPNICRREMYLWSPQTCVFSPSSILNRLKEDLILSGRVSFVISEVIGFKLDKTSLESRNGCFSSYDYIYNVSGPGALKLFQSVSSKLDHLRMIPFIGEYANLTYGPYICTNLYPVPDPDLPFLGVHVTPQTGNSCPIIGPNALPFTRSYLDEHLSSDFLEFLPRLMILLGFYASNSANFMSHTHSEFALSKTQKFYRHSIRFFDSASNIRLKVAMNPNVYGIRPQLVDFRALSFVNDFICERTANVCHVVNAVSPAFTSSMALAKLLVKTLLC